MQQLDTPHVGLQFSRPIFGGEKTEGLKIVIEPGAFADLAREMMKADPQQAIRAFGNALQDFQIEKSDQEQVA